MRYQALIWQYPYSLRIPFNIWFKGVDLTLPHF